MRTFLNICILILLCGIVFFLIEYHPLMSRSVGYETDAWRQAHRSLAEVVPEDVQEYLQAQAINQRKLNSNLQVVVISFDGSRSLNTWRKTLDFAREMRDAGAPISFTYFISGIYLLPEHQKNWYHLSWLYPGRSGIGFGDSVATTDQRIEYFNRAIADGHEIGSHLNGHFDGSGWSYDQWAEEFDMFDTILFDTFPEPITRNVQLDLALEDIQGIRVPLLAKNDHLYRLLGERGYTYDASRVAPMGTHPWKDRNGVWQFPLVYLEVGDKRSLSMDYNHYVAQTNARDRLEAGTPEWEQAKTDVVDAYREYFEFEYAGSRAPIHIGHHFSMWNDGVYWEALKEFAGEVCGKPDVLCTNYRELVEMLEDNE